MQCIAVRYIKWIPFPMEGINENSTFISQNWY